MDKQEEYKQLFVAEALEMHQALEAALLALEKDYSSKASLQELFRITHTIKGNAQGMGYEALAGMAHTLEDVFDHVLQGHMQLNASIIEMLLKAADLLKQLIHAITTHQKVAYRGLKKKLQLLVQPTNQNATEQKPLTKAATASQPAAAPPPTEAIAATFSDYIQVPVAKLDGLLNLVGELVIERDRLIAQQPDQRANGQYSLLNRISADLQYAVMNVRLIQVGFLFKKFHRVVRDAATTEQKQVELRLEGTDTEIDRNILQVISDSLIHLLRNAVGHGIEPPQQRQAAGKPPVGQIKLTAANENQKVRITIEDDGQGLNTEKIRQQVIEKQLLDASLCQALPNQQINAFIFEPGFSTAQNISSISGRGVGLDVVKKALDQVGGQINIESTPGKGTAFHLYMPASMAVKSVLLFELQQQVMAIPLANTEFVATLYKSQVFTVGHGLVARYLKHTFPLYHLSDLLHQRPHNMQAWGQLHSEASLQVIVVQVYNQLIGLVVDKLMQQKEVVEKPLAKPLHQLSYVNGVTILGNGQICLVINIPTLLGRLARNQQVNSI